jgi:hypothetical protein
MTNDTESLLRQVFACYERKDCAITSTGCLFQTLQR